MKGSCLSVSQQGVKRDLKLEQQEAKHKPVAQMPAKAVQVVASVAPTVEVARLQSERKDLLHRSEYIKARRSSYELNALKWKLVFKSLCALFPLSFIGC